MGIKVRWRDGWAHASGTIKGVGRVRESLGTRDPEQAEELRAALEARLHRERVYGREAVVTFEEAVERYALHLRDQGKAARYLAPLLRHFRGRVLGSITAGEVKDAARKLLPDAKLSTRRRQVVTPTCAVINFAAKEYGWCQPIRMDYPTGPAPERVAIGYDWIDAVRAASGPHLAAMVLFLYQTGFRVGEAVRLAPEDFDLGKSTVRAGRTKNGSPRLMALTPEMVAELRTLPPREGRALGYTSEAGVRQGLRRACKRAGVPYLGTHQPGRHSFATALDELGMGGKAIADAGGWRTVRIAENRYIHPDAPEAKAAALLSRGTNLAQPAEVSANPLEGKGADDERRPKFRDAPNRALDLARALISRENLPETGGRGRGRM